MSELNKTLEIYRDTHRNCSNYNNIKEVLNQLLVIGFNNEDKPNELPDEFMINSVHFNESNFNSLMLDIGFKVKTQEKFVDFYSQLYTYVVTII